MSKIAKYKECQKKVELVESYIKMANDTHSWDKFNFKIVQAETWKGTYGHSGTSSWDSIIIEGLISLLSGRQKESLLRLKELWLAEMEKARTDAREEALSVLDDTNDSKTDNL